MIKLNLFFENKITLEDPFVGWVYQDKDNKKNYHVKNQIIILNEEIHDFDNDEIWLVFPKTNLINRFYRSSSNSNTILLTERCDQYCVMCSQPPKAKDYLHFDLFKEAINLISGPSVIGITGGEPTLYKKELFDLIRDVIKKNNEITFHILSNGQHFEETDIHFLTSVNQNVLWAIPFYSDLPDLHNQIVGKDGAYKKLLSSFNILMSSGSRVELRTVLLKQNYENFLSLSKFVNEHFQWIEYWSIMQLEKFGFARINWAEKFVDTSRQFEILDGVLSMSDATDLNVQLFNFPTCSVPPKWRKLCFKSISDWKQKYISECQICIKKNDCCGFFEWYDEKDGYENIRAIC